MTSTTDQLLTVLRDVSATPTLEYAAPPEPLTGGFWAELFILRVTGGPVGWPADLVARLMPDAVVAAKETAIQAEVARLGFPTPTVRAAGGPADGLGRAFMVMDFAAGKPLLDGLDGLDGVKALAQLPRLAATLPDTLASAMARLHRIDAEAVRARIKGGAAATTVTEMVDWIRSSTEDAGRPDLTGAASWLIAHPPDPAPEVVCHGDLHPFNLLVDDRHQVTVLDWSASMLGPAAYDVAFTSLLLAEPPLTFPRPLQPVVALAARSLSRSFRRKYRHHSGTTIDPTSLRWHQGVVCLRALAEVAGWDDAEREMRAGHPWLISGRAFASRLSQLTGSSVRAR